jgi:hypothetical protein
MAAKYVLAVLACVFLIAAGSRVARDGSVRHPQARTWLTIACIFGGVSAWLFYTA